MLEHAAGIGYIWANRNAEGCAPPCGIEGFDGVGQHRTRRCRPDRAGDGNRAGRRNLVTPVVQHGGWIAGKGDVVVERDDITDVEHVIAIIAGQGSAVLVWRAAICGITIAPNLRIGLGGIGNIQLIAVFPLIVIDDRIIGSD